VAAKLDREALLDLLEPVRYERPEDQSNDPLEQMTLAGALPALTQITHEKLYTLCQSLAKHLLGTIPEPADIDPGEE
jgi:hypothetical protein